MCGFCHAPEHAYEALMDAGLDTTGLCDDATERLLIALVDEPPATDPSIEWAWNEELHAWVAWRIWGSCAACAAKTWRYANESCAHECAACVARLVDIACALALLANGVPLDDADLDELLAGLSRQRDPPTPRSYLTFSDYLAPDSRLFANLAGPRFGSRRPRILFGQAARPERATKRAGA